ncbi:hypothetical protein BX600DRAFT_468346 [Xylariales sp. PMI_506]|nr:hypothetical protein BX600DRAFT_468346 [Xylariales sp. PMI_506]
MLIFFEPTAMCGLHPCLLLVSLPANKQLWEAGDQLASLYGRQQPRENWGAKTAFAPAATREVVKLEDHQM